MQPRSSRFEAIGTVWELTIRDPVDEHTWEQILQRVRQRIATFDRQYSRFRADSLVAQMAAQAGSYKLPADGYALLRFYEQLYHATGGKVTPLIGQTIADAGYDADYSLIPRSAVRRPPSWEDTLSYNRTSITLAAPALLDFGAAGKGYLVDIIGDLLKQTGLASYTIDAGGDILHCGNSVPLEVALENPFDISEAVGIAQLPGGRSLCASSGSKRAWGRWHHIIDPELLESPRSIAATWVMAADTMTADGLATALFFVPPAALHEHFSFSCAVLDDAMMLTNDPDFPVTVFNAP